MLLHYVIKNLFSSALFGFIALTTIACSPVKILNTFVPSDGFKLYADIAYGNKPRQELDVYQPSLPNKKLPVVIFFYGGNWDSGDKADYKFVAEALTSNGFVTVIPDYRVFPVVTFPGVMADPVSAAKWVKDHIFEYGGDPNRIFLVGHSAGAHVAVMLSLNEEYLAVEGLNPSDFRGSIGSAGPYDFLPLKTDRLKAIFGPESQRWRSQPIEFVTGHNQPMLLLVGLKDDVVLPKNTFNLAKKIKANGGLIEVVEFPNYNHTDMVSKLAKPLRGDGLLLKTMLNFMNVH